MTSLEISPRLRSSTIARALGVDHLADHLLVAAGAVLVAVVLVSRRLARARREPAAAVVVEPAHPLDRVVARPLLLAELVEPRQRRVGRGAAPEQLLALLGAVVVDVEPADQQRQREPLHARASRRSPRR